MRLPVRAALWLALLAPPAALMAAGAQDALDRGAGLFLTGRLDSAIAFFSGALKNNPKDTRAKEILGHCLAIKGKDALRAGDYAGARDSLRRAAEIFPKDDSLKTLALLAELDLDAPTPSVPLSTATLNTSAETGAVFDCLFGEGECAKGGRYVIHVVRAGETMAEIAIRYYGDLKLWEKIWGANPQLANPHRLEKGVRLLIPLDK
ncbi:MAG: tail protein X [Elusimicrobiales bacterium]